MPGVTGTGPAGFAFVLAVAIVGALPMIWPLRSFIPCASRTDASLFRGGVK
jgi:hypothetical protein